MLTVILRPPFASDVALIIIHLCGVGGELVRAGALLAGAQDGNAVSALGAFICAIAIVHELEHMVARQSGNLGVAAKCRSIARNDRQSERESREILGMHSEICVTRKKKGPGKDREESVAE